MAVRDNLGYLLVRLCKAHKRHADVALRRLGLHTGQELVLAELWERESMSQVELADRLCIEPPTVTKMLQRMEAAGLVVRRSDPEDARRSLVSATRRGRELRDAVETAWRGLDEAMTAGLRPEERMLLRRLLRQMRDSLDAG